MSRQPTRGRTPARGKKEFEDEFSQRTRELREGANFTQRQMAEHLGCGEEAYRKYEGRSPLPIHLLGKFARVVGADLDYLINGAPSEPQKVPGSVSNIRQAIDPAGMKFAGMSQAVRCGDWILVSGQVAIQDGKVVGAGDAERQARQCFANIGTVLREAGASLADIVNLRCYLVAKEAFGGYAKAKNALFAERSPASTTVIVKDLLLPDLLMEVEAVAWKPSSSQ